MSVRLASGVLAAAVCLAACGQSSKSNAPASVPAGTTYSLTFSPGTVQPGQEYTKCVVLRLGNPTPIHVGTIHNTLSNGSHHMIVYRSAETVEQKTPFDCVPFTDTLDPSKGSTLMVTQKRDDVLNLPEGVGFTLDANQMIRIELHYLDATSTPLDVTATTTFVTMADSQFKDEADFLFIGDPDISIAANSSQTLGPIFFQLPSEYASSKFFAITGHEHRLGTDVTVSVAKDATDPGKSVYDVPGWLWSEPTTVVANPPFTIPPNGGFNFTCKWTNTTDQTVSFGESAMNEMCFFWAYYYPSQGARVCMHSDKVNQAAGGLDVCCPGPSFICSLIQSKLADGG
jgi:hypothetical protein